jgi:hypothetical protein
VLSLFHESTEEAIRSRNRICGSDLPEPIRSLAGRPSRQRAGPGQCVAYCSAGMDAYWRAANYLSVGQICLYNNLPMRKSLELSYVKPEVSGTGTRHRVGPRGPGCRDKLIALENWL